MSLSSFLLVLWVFLVASVTQLNWFVVDSKLIGYVGIAFVVAWVLEVILARTGHADALHFGPRKQVV